MRNLATTLVVSLVLTLTTSAQRPGRPRPGDTPGEPNRRVQSLAPPVALDTNPDPNIVEYTISANVATWQFQTGVDTTVWAYSDDAPGGVGASVPGPTLMGNVGDTMIVHFTNNLPEETTVHWHGIEVPATQDGSHISQLTIPPGGTFDYQFVLPRQGLYWYHPHVRPFDGVERGLHAVVRVLDIERGNKVFAGRGTRTVEEQIIVFDDVLLDTEGQVVPAFSFTDPLQNAMYQLNGRVGNVLLLNGKEVPPTGVPLTVTNGAIQSWYVVNVANTTFCRLSVTNPQYATGPGINGDLWELGSDGGFNEFEFKRLDVYSTQPLPDNGDGDEGEGEVYIDHPSQALLDEMYSGILCYPGERMQVAFTPLGNDGDKFTVQSWDFFRGRHLAVWNSTMTQILLPDDPLDGGYPTVPYIEMTLQGANPGTGEWVPDFKLSFGDPGPPPQRSIPFTFGHGLPDPSTGNVTLFAQADFSSGAMVPLPTPKIGSFEAHDVSVGETAMWEVTNLTHGEHNFHTHGFFFELQEYEFLDPGNMLPPLYHRPPNEPTFPRRIKDTIRIPPRLGAKGTSKTITRLKVHFDDTGREGQVVAEGEVPTFDRDGNVTSGGWLAHCHILEHSAKGMLSFFEVRDPNQPFELLGKHLAGTRGNPYLTARGDRSSGVSFDLVNALPNKEVFLLGSHMLYNQPYKGGTLVPMPTLLERGTGMSRLRRDVTDEEGRITWDFNAKASFQTYWQVLFRDPGAPQGWAMSNAVLVR